MTTATDTKPFDVNRATDVLNKAAEHKMYEAGEDGKAVLPESDADKIAEAEKLVAMAQQAREIAEEAGKDKVVHYDAVMEILFIADVIGGSSTDGQSGAEDPLAAVALEISEGNRAAAQVIREAAEAAAGGPPLGEEWVDENGTPWVVRGIVDQAGNIEVSPAGSDEVTSIPLANLKTRTKEAPPSTPPPQPASPSQPSAEAEASPPSASSSGGEQSPPETSSSTPAEPPQPQQPVESSPSRSSSPDPGIPVDDDEGDPLYANLLEKSELTFTKTGLPLPLALVEQPTMPEDLTAIGDERAQKLHSQFNACAARAHFMLGIERQRKIDCKRLMNFALKQPMRDAREALGKDATVTELKSKAEDDENVKKWAERAERHADQEDAYKTLFDIYTENVSVLSRDWTMRDKDEQGS